LLTAILSIWRVINLESPPSRLARYGNTFGRSIAQNRTFMIASKLMSAFACQPDADLVCFRSCKQMAIAIAMKLD
jgi:hypothetical protein